jgi:signal transduction histidine kinase
MKPDVSAATLFLSVLGGAVVRVLRNPVAQFAVAAVIVVIAVAFATDALSRRAAEREAVTDARALTEVLAHSVAEPMIPDGLVDADEIAATIFDDRVRDRLMVSQVKRIKVWNADGVVVWSDQAELVGQSFSLSEDARAVLAGGGSSADLSNLRDPENRFEVNDDGLLEVYTRIENDHGIPMLFEVYYSAAQLEESSETVFAAFRPITLGGPLLLGLLTAPLLWMLTRRVARSAEARERLLRNAVDASEAERRRIARDLHEGVVHNLATASLALAAESADPSTPPQVARRLRTVDEGIRGTVQSLRSLVLEIYPPNLAAGGLADALDELVVPASASGLDVRVRVDDVTGVSDDAVALVWRAAQEAVRNATRHARGSRIDVSVLRHDRRVSLRVADDGVGFVPGAFSHQGRFGLRSLQDLAVEAGGRLDVETGPGRGTTVLLEVPA